MSKRKPIKPTNATAGGDGGSPPKRETAELAAPASGDVFADPRRQADRRRYADPAGIPTTGCRRRAARRTSLYLKGDQWWMKRNYSSHS